MQYFELVERAVAWLSERKPVNFTPRVGLTLGTGLSGLAGNIEELCSFSYAEIPGFPVSTVDSHAGRLILGHLSGCPVAALAGRFHLYEGYTAREVTFPVRVLAELGLEAFIFCNAAGGLDLSMEPGRVMLISDHINFTGDNPLTGPNHEQWGERFPDMSQVYDPGLLELARDCARRLGIQMFEGVYLGLRGPSMETPAETRMLRVLGADAVGMSTVLEAIAARHHGLRVLGFSAISNLNDPGHMEPAPLELVIENASRAGAELVRIIAALLARLDGCR